MINISTVCKYVVKEKRNKKHKSLMTKPISKNALNCKYCCYKYLSDHYISFLISSFAFYRPHESESTI